MKNEGKGREKGKGGKVGTTQIFTWIDTYEYLSDTGVSDCQVIDIANAFERKLTAASRSVLP